nr:hypothetical protein [Rhodococcus sp. KBS0724]
MGQELIDTGQKPGLSSIESAELTAARRRIAELATELAIAERSTELLKSVAAAKAVRSSRSDGQLPVQTSCQVLEVSESGFYEWRNRPPSERSPRHAWLTQLITEVHVASNGTYGARRVHGRTHPWSRHCRGARLYRIVDESCWREKTSGKQTGTFQAPDSTTRDLVDRKFTRDEPNKLWVTNITEHPTPWIPAIVATPTGRCCNGWQKSTRINRRKNSSDYSRDVARSAPQRERSAFMKTPATTGSTQRNLLNTLQSNMSRIQ